MQTKINNSAPGFNGKDHRPGGQRWPWTAKALVLILVVILLGSCRTVSKTTSRHDANLDSVASHKTDSTVTHTVDADTVHKITASRVTETADTDDHSITVNLDPVTGDTSSKVINLGWDCLGCDKVTVEADTAANGSHTMRIRVPGNTKSVVIHDRTTRTRKDSSGVQVTDSSHFHAQDSAALHKADTTHLATHTLDTSSTVKKCGLAFSGVLLILGIVIVFVIYWKYFRKDRPRPMASSKPDQPSG